MNIASALIEFGERSLRIGTNGISYYDILFYSGFVGLMIYLLVIRKHYNYTVFQTVAFAVVVYTVTVLWMFFLFTFEQWVRSGFKTWMFTGGNNIVRVFWWLGVFVLPVSLILKMGYFKALDFVSPCLCINHGIAHFGCIFAGCCHGYPCDWGIYSNNAGHKCFPNQPIEAIVAIGIAVYIWNRERKKGYGKNPDGLSFPIMLMLFGYSRFFLEFLRDNDKIIFKDLHIGSIPLGISALAIHALVNAVIGTIAYFIIKKYNAKKQA
ncbi:MAG: prolipoprotein diacylglyceryl transferase [Clostridia bacterium]|nr:prolipoprotein diacylglyceryl transferase [Clostridia bacterium]